MIATRRLFEARVLVYAPAAWSLKDVRDDVVDRLAVTPSPDPEGTDVLVLDVHGVGLVVVQRQPDAPRGERRIGQVQDVAAKRAGAVCDCEGTPHCKVCLPQGFLCFVGPEAPA